MVGNCGQLLFEVVVALIGELDNDGASVGRLAVPPMDQFGALEAVE